MFDINIESEYSDYLDCDNYDLNIATIPSDNIPYRGDIIVIDNQKYLVNDIIRRYWDITECFSERIVVYVLKI